jgi:hypothetical protein
MTLTEANSVDCSGSCCTDLIDNDAPDFTSKFPPAGADMFGASNFDDEFDF